MQAKYHCSEEWLDQDGNGFSPEQNCYVGGNTKFYGAALFRLRPEDFGVIRHHGGISPAWPLSLPGLRAFLRRGRAPLLGARHRWRGPHRGAAQRRVRLPGDSARAPHPRTPPEPGDPGAAPLPPAPRVLLDQDEHGEPTHTSACIRWDRVDGCPCLVNGKADAQTICVDPPWPTPM